MKINFEVENLKFKQGFDEGSVEKLKGELELSLFEVQEILKGGEKELLLELLKRVAK